MPAGDLGLCATEQRRSAITVCHKLTPEKGGIMEDIDRAVNEMYSVLKPAMSPAAREWVDDDIEANEPYSALLMLISCALGTNVSLAQKYMYLLEPEDREEYLPRLSMAKKRTQ